MKLTRYIILVYGACSETLTYMGGRDKDNQFAPYSIPNNLGKLFDRKGQALKKAKELNDEELKYNSDIYHSVSRVTIEIEDEIERES